MSRWARPGWAALAAGAALSAAAAALPGPPSRGSPVPGGVGATLALHGSGPGGPLLSLVGLPPAAVVTTGGSAYLLQR